MKYDPKSVKIVSANRQPVHEASAMKITSQNQFTFSIFQHT